MKKAFNFLSLLLCALILIAIGVYVGDKSVTVHIEGVDFSENGSVTIHTKDGTYIKNVTTSNISPLIFYSSGEDSIEIVVDTGKAAYRKKLYIQSRQELKLHLKNNTIELRR